MKTNKNEYTDEVKIKQMPLLDLMKLVREQMLKEMIEMIEYPYSTSYICKAVLNKVKTKDKDYRSNDPYYVAIQRQYPRFTKWIKNNGTRLRKGSFGSYSFTEGWNVTSTTIPKRGYSIKIKKLKLQNYNAYRLHKVDEFIKRLEKEK